MWAVSELLERAKESIFILVCPFFFSRSPPCASRNIWGRDGPKAGARCISQGGVGPWYRGTEVRQTGRNALRALLLNGIPRPGMTRMRALGGSRSASTSCLIMRSAGKSQLLPFVSSSPEPMT